MIKQDVIKKTVTRSILVSESRYRDLLRIEKVVQSFAFKIDLPATSESEMIGIECVINDEINKTRISRK